MLAIAEISFTTINALDNYYHLYRVEINVISVRVQHMLNSRVVETTSGRSARKIKLSLMGPAFITAIGYIDPGNFATNIQAGASFGYSLLWVVVWANVMAMLIQLLSAKLGIATGKTWPSIFAIAFRGRRCGPIGCRRRSSPWRPIWPSLSARRSASSCCSAFPCCRARC